MNIAYEIVSDKGVREVAHVREEIATCGAAFALACSSALGAEARSEIAAGLKLYTVRAHYEEVVLAASEEEAAQIALRETAESPARPDMVSVSAVGPMRAIPTGWDRASIPLGEVERDEEGTCWTLGELMERLAVEEPAVSQREFLMAAVMKALETISADPRHGDGPPWLDIEQRLEIALTALQPFDFRRTLEAANNLTMRAYTIGPDTIAINDDDDGVYDHRADEDSILFEVRIAEEALERASANFESRMACLRRLRAARDVKAKEAT